MRICHLLASDTTEEELLTIGQLLDGMDRHHFGQSLVSIHPPTGKWASELLDVDVRRLHLRMGGIVGSMDAFGQADGRPDLVHVWSGQAAPVKSLMGAEDLAVVVAARLAASSGAARSGGLARVLRRATVVCDGQTIRAEVIRRGCEPGRCTVVPPGATAKRATRGGVLTREGLGLPPDQPVLLSPGPPSRQAGQYYAVWATALLQQIFPAVRLIVPGDTPERVRLERFVRSFELPEILVCTRNRYSLAQLIGVSDVLVAPALTDLPTGGAVQGMGAGLPVVASDVAALRERIEDGVTGLLVPPANPTKLAGAVLQVLEDDALREQLTSTARQHARQTYPPGRLVERYETVYEQAYCRARTLAMGR